MGNPIAEENGSETLLEKPFTIIATHVCESEAPLSAGRDASSSGHTPPDPVNRGIVLPTPHPLDYEWRFGTTTIEFLLQACQEMTHECDTVALLGAPSLLQAGIKGSYPRKLLLFDTNPALAGCFAGYTQMILCDLMSDAVPEAMAAAVVADPPWYEGQTCAFLWAASRICQTQGHIFLSLPPIDTRPGIELERERLLEWAQLLGLRLKHVKPASLSYLSPPFEANAFKAGGLTGLPGEWRRGDLFIFKLHSRRDVPRRAGGAAKYDWDEVDLSGVRIRVRHSEERVFHDPSLISVIPGDVLPSVSQRDERRVLAEVWTSGNRIFGCDGKAVLREIMAALAKDTSPMAAVSEFLKQRLGPEEESLILKASGQISNLAKVEREEYVDIAALREGLCAIKE